MNREHTRPPKHRILSMDGGPSLVFYLRMLREIVRERPTFLDQVDLFAGTSAGSICALYMAKYDKGANGHEIVDNTIHIANQLVSKSNPGFCGRLRFLSGLTSIDNTNRLHDVLTKHLRIDDQHTTLGDLPRRVTAVSFSLLNKWKPKIFHNFSRNHKEPDLTKNVIDVALASSAFPVYYPLHHGHIDGGLFANNPSMCALAQIMAYGDAEDVNDVAVLSTGSENPGFGSGPNETAMHKDRLSWGWLKWLLQLKHPLLLLDVLINADATGVDFQCRHILGQDRFKRLAIAPPYGAIGSFFEIFFGLGKSLEQQAEDLAKHWRYPDYMSSDPAYSQRLHKHLKHSDYPTFQEMIEWLDAYWFNPHEAKACVVGHADGFS